jgi:hypothetical protein
MSLDNETQSRELRKELMMGMREITIEAMKKRNAGISKDEIHALLRSQAALLWITTEEDHGDRFALRLTTTGEVIRYDDRNGYSYSASGA